MMMNDATDDGRQQQRRQQQQQQQFRQRSTSQRIECADGKTIDATPRRTRRRHMPSGSCPFRIRRIIGSYHLPLRRRHRAVGIDDNYAKYGKRNVGGGPTRRIRVSLVAICISLILVLVRPVMVYFGYVLYDDIDMISLAERRRTGRKVLRRGESSSHDATTATRDDVVRSKILHHPKSYVLTDGHRPALLAYRSFPFARKTVDRWKERDDADVDYGGLVHDSVRNEGILTRFIPRIIINSGRDDHEYDGDIVVPGGFDPDSIEPEQDLKERNRMKRKEHGSYPVYAIDGKEILNVDASLLDLRNYYDDDVISVKPKANDPKVLKPRACQEPEFRSYYFPTCNDFHERDMGRAYDDPTVVSNPRPENEVNIRYLASGFYRDTWILEDEPWVLASPYTTEELDEMLHRNYGVSNEERTYEMIARGYRSAILKTPRMAHNIGPGFYDEVWTEAIIMERLTKSPRIINIYGHCGYSTMVEVVPIEFEEVAIRGEGVEKPDVVEERNRDGVRPYNNFTSSEKLRFALDMAESLADMHGFEGGIIVHDDVQMCQWLRTPDGRLKLGDFNRATIMSWDLLKGEYCKFNNGEAFSQYRAPEEYAARNLNEKIDIFSFGNNIYAMLTGLWNWYEMMFEKEDDDAIQTKLIDGELPFVDPRYKNRSFAEKKLVELMYKCWIYDPDERISSFEAVKFLRKAVRDNEEKEHE